MSFNVTRWYQWLPWLSALVLVVVCVWLMSIDLSSHRTAWQEQQRWQQDAQERFLKGAGRDLTQQSMLLVQLVARDQEVISQVRQNWSRAAAARWSNGVHRCGNPWLVIGGI
jgi:hypothetical protein